MFNILSDNPPANCPRCSKKCQPKTVRGVTRMHYICDVCNIKFNWWPNTDAY